MIISKENLQAKASDLTSIGNRLALISLNVESLAISERNKDEFITQYFLEKMLDPIMEELDNIKDQLKQISNDLCS